MQTPPIIRSLTAADAQAYQALRLRALAECPAAFSANFADEVGRTLAEIEARVAPAADGSVRMFGACIDDELVGFIAVIRPMRAKLTHCASLAGTYVAPEFRGRRIGHGLMQAVIAHARSLEGVRHLKLTVTQNNAPARRLYESFGFVRFGIEPEALYVDGEYFDDEHFSLRLI